MKNRLGQAMIEALIVAVFCFLSIYYIFSGGLRLIEKTLKEEVREDHYIRSQKP